jgi:hypothetical protein
VQIHELIPTLPIRPVQIGNATIWEKLTAVAQEKESVIIVSAKVAQAHTQYVNNA